LQVLLSRLTGITIASLIAGFAAGFLPASHFGFSTASDRSRLLPGSVRCKPGPWGDLAYTPFTIAAPDDLLPIRSIEARGTHWFFHGYTADALVALLQSTSLSPDQQRELLSPEVMHVQPDGIDLTPSPDFVISMPDDARNKLVTILAEFPEAEKEFPIIASDTVDQLFTANGVAPSTVALFKRLCCPRGNYLVVSSLPALLSRLPTYEEKRGLAKAITSQRTMLLRLHVTPRTDINALAQYWGRGSWDTDVRTIFQTLPSNSDGAWLSITLVLPPLPSAEIYNFQTVEDNPLSGPAVNRDCAWTALNFFNESPDPRFGTFPAVLHELQSNYVAVPDAPRYGDVIFFSKPDGSVVHAAVYMADNICFTKNGSGIVNPWMLSTIQDVTEHYAYQLQPGQNLKVSYYRNKISPEQKYAAAQ
jgi:hypothetical protein